MLLIFLYASPTMRCCQPGKSILDEFNFIFKRNPSRLGYRPLPTSSSPSSRDVGGTTPGASAPAIFFSSQSRNRSANDQEAFDDRGGSPEHGQPGVHWSSHQLLAITKHAFNTLDCFVWTDRFAGEMFTKPANNRQLDPNDNWL
jgi:hypothetical protein